MKFGTVLPQRGESLGPGRTLRTGVADLVEVVGLHVVAHVLAQAALLAARSASVAHAASARRTLPHDQLIQQQVETVAQRFRDDGKFF